MSLNTDDLVKKMLDALKKEYQTRKGRALPPGFEEDREILFAAIARGILEYLESQQNDFISTITLRKDAILNSYEVTSLDLNISP